VILASIAAYSVDISGAWGGGTGVDGGGKFSKCDVELYLTFSCRARRRRAARFWKCAQLHNRQEPWHGYTSTVGFISCQRIFCIVSVLCADPGNGIIMKREENKVCCRKRGRVLPFYQYTVVPQNPFQPTIGNRAPSPRNPRQSTPRMNIDITIVLSGRV